MSYGLRKWQGQRVALPPTIDGRPRETNQHVAGVEQKARHIAIDKMQSCRRLASRGRQRRDIRGVVERRTNTSFQLDITCNTIISGIIKVSADV